ncbi:hypothetical protein NRY67_15330, partial [Acidithiobacillus ferrooxidans]|uniref:hypothetical protein n=1 Tax=Acidithiobacillus ferrooxidans TaxID=920 RepID=UPI0021494475
KCERSSSDQTENISVRRNRSISVNSTWPIVINLAFGRTKLCLKPSLPHDAAFTDHNSACYVPAGGVSQADSAAGFQTIDRDRRSVV